jgi:hypothetical protein
MRLLHRPRILFGPLLCPITNGTPNNAFWSLTVGDTHNDFVLNPINRYSVGDRSGLVPNVDGSVGADFLAEQFRGCYRARFR